jgi:hypothetical protein
MRLNDRMRIFVESPDTLRIKILRDIVDSEVRIL